MLDNVPTQEYRVIMADAVVAGNDPKRGLVCQQKTGLSKFILVLIWAWRFDTPFQADRPQCCQVYDDFICLLYTNLAVNAMYDQ